MRIIQKNAKLTLVLLACVARAQVDETITVAGRDVVVHIPGRHRCICDVANVPPPDCII
jgi:hypothetical protein